MNILFFLTPKEEVAHVEEDDTLRQVVEKLGVDRDLVEKADSTAGA
jgi:hypothetical protein